MPEYHDETQIEPPQISEAQDAAAQQHPVQPAARRVPVWRLIGTLLSIGLLVYLIRAQGWDAFAEVFSKLPGYAFWLALGLVLLSRLCVSLRWFALLRTARVKISFWQVLRLTFMGLFASNFLPTTVGGDLVRLPGAVAQHVDAGVSAASLVLDRLVGMAGMSSLAPIGLALILQPAAPGAGSGAQSAIQAAGGVLAGLSRLPGVGWAYAKLRKFFQSVLHSSVYWLRHPLSLVWALLATYGHMLFTFLAIAVLLSGMQQNIALWKIAGLWSLSYFITLVPVSINGLGWQELSITYLYSQFGGVSNEAGLALALLWRFLPLFASLPGVIFLPDILHSTAKQQASDLSPAPAPIDAGPHLP